MRKEKQLLLDGIKDQIHQSNGAFLICKYQKLAANKANSFRREIAKLGSGMEVVRKRILVKAAAEAGIALDLKDLPGHIALIYGGQDPIETTKVLFRFGEENDKVVEVIGGRFEGQLFNAP